MPKDIEFPTSRQRGPASYEATVIEVFTGFNAQYGPDGRDGLYIKIKYEKSGKTRDIFYPALPAAKTDRLMQAIADDLNMDLSDGGWSQLEGYHFRWANEEEPREIFDKETKQRRTVKVKLEYPVEVIRTPEQNAAHLEGTDDASGSNGVSAPVTEAAEVEGDYEAFKDEILMLADGKTERTLRLAAAQTKEIRSFPKEFREKLNRGETVEELISANRLETATENGETVYKMVI